MFEKKTIEYCERETKIRASNVERVLELLIKEECTVPFVARYRKEVTGNLDEVQIRAIQSAYEQCLEIEKRRHFISETLKKMEALTPELEKSLCIAETLEQLEDLYAPFKSKKKTKAMLARERGLAPLAEMILTSKMDLAAIEKTYTLPEGVESFSLALDGAKDILVEHIAHHTEAKERLRSDYWDKAFLSSTLRSKGEEISNAKNFQDFFHFKEPIKTLKDEKNSHRYLAMRRGLTLKVLKLEVEYDAELAISTLSSFFLHDLLGCTAFLRDVIATAYKVSIHTSLDLEIKTELKRFADEAAIKVFGVNLKSLLLAPYLGPKTVMGVDPGVRTGCKIVVIDAYGKLQVDCVIYPHGSDHKEQEAKVMIEKLIDHFHIEHIAIGNGTFGRETLAFFEDHITAVKSEKVKVTMISEAGASIYSASDIARKEFPDKDTTVRGAVSIARRFQDPLAELVKIDPKSIGVGQYQHDVSETKLKKSLEEVVESCVNYVGVDINTASAPLLSYISGIGPKLAESIVGHRQKTGAFKRREDFLTIPRFTQKIYEQSAGFLRIYDGEHPLDGTFIHPEKYSSLENWAKNRGIALNKLVEDQGFQNELAGDKTLEQAIGVYTFKDILSSLKAPKQDPRKVFKSIEFSRTLRDFKDLKTGEWYTGIVNNITQFGAFIDIGIKESGLLHISEMASEFVENPLSKLHVGQEIKVRVIGIDVDRKRISLSCRKGGQLSSPSSGGGKSSSASKVQEIKNNPFSVLKKLAEKR